MVLIFVPVCSKRVHIPPQLLQAYLGEDSMHICSV
jgi:hypothetical protein